MAVDACYERYERMMQRHTDAVHRLGGIAEPSRASSYTFARWLDIAEGWREVAVFCSKHGDLERASWASRLHRRITNAVTGETARHALLAQPRERYWTRIEGLEAEVRHHPRTDRWSVTLYTRDRKTTIPGLDGATAAQAEHRTRELLARHKRGLN